LRKNSSNLNLPFCLTIHERFDGKKCKQGDVERQALAGQSNESWRDRTLLLVDSLPL